MKKIIISVVLLYCFLLPINFCAMQRATQSVKRVRPVKPKPATLVPIKPAPAIVIPPIEAQKTPSLIGKSSLLLPSQPSQFNLPKELSVDSSWALVDLLDPSPTNIIEALNNNRQPTADSFNAMIETQKANKFRVGFVTDELIEALGEQAELLFPKDQHEWFTLKNESGETIFESHPLPAGYMFLKKLGKDSELLILGEQTSSLKNSMEKLHIPADLSSSKFLKTTQTDFTKLFSAELRQVERIQSAAAEKELAQAKEKGLVVDINEPQLQTDATRQLLAQKDNSLFTKMADSGLYEDSSYIKNNQEKLARLRSVPANAESAENFFEQLQENFEKKKAKAAKKSAKIATEQAQKAERAQQQEVRIAQEHAELQRKAEAQALEQKKHESQIKIAELAEQIKEAQKMVEQELFVKNQRDKEVQLKAQEAHIKMQTDPDFEQFLKELAEIEMLEKEVADTATTMEQVQTEIEAQEKNQREQAEQKRIAIESRQEAQATLNYGEKLPIPNIPSPESKKGISLKPIVPEAIFEDTPEEKPLQGLSKFKPENNLQTQTVPAYTIPELTPTTPADRPTVEEFISPGEDTFVSAPQQPSSASSTTYAIPAPSYTNSAAQIPTPSVATQINQGAAPQVASAQQQQRPGLRSLGEVGNQGLSVPSFHQKYGQTTSPAGLATRQGNTAAYSGTSRGNASPYNRNESEIASQRPEFNWPADMARSLSSSTSPHLYNNTQSPPDVDSSTPRSSWQLSDRQYAQNKEFAAASQQLDEKTISKNQSVTQEITTAKVSQKSAHWFWRLIAFIINWVKKLLHLS